MHKELTPEQRERRPFVIMAYISRLGRDLCLITTGLLLLNVTPPSLKEFGIYGVVSIAWAAMLGLGATVSLMGVFYRRVSWEIYGCLFVGFGFLVWGIAALVQPERTGISLALALVFFSGTFGQFYRVAMAALGRSGKI